MNHPACQLTCQARTPANADLRTTTAPVISDPGGWPYQRVSIWGMRDSTMHFSCDAQICQYRHAVQAFFQPRHNTFIIRIKQLIFRIPRTVIFPHRIRVFFLINPDKPALLFHPDIARNFFIISDNRQLSFEISKFRHCLCDEIMMRH